MNPSAPLSEDPRAPLWLDRILDAFVLCIEAPDRAALRVAGVLTASGLSLSYLAALFGKPAGADLALVYIASAWLLVFCLRRRAGAAAHVG